MMHAPVCCRPRPEPVIAQAQVALHTAYDDVTGTTKGTAHPERDSEADDGSCCHHHWNCLASPVIIQIDTYYITASPPPPSCNKALLPPHAPLPPPGSIQGQGDAYMPKITYSRSVLQCSFFLSSFGCMLFDDNSIKVFFTKSFLFPPVDCEGTLFRAIGFAYYVHAYTVHLIPCEMRRNGNAHDDARKYVNTALKVMWAKAKQGSW